MDYFEENFGTKREQNDSTSGIPETYVVTETRSNHTDTFTGSQESSGSSYYQSQHTTQSYGGEKKSGFRMNVVGLIAICLVCSILGALVSVAVYRTALSTDTTLTSRTSSAGETTELTNTTTSVSAQPVTITVDSTVASPATAVAQKVLPSIVGIKATVTSTSYWYGTTTTGSVGSGVIFSEDGYIITNYHVISSALTTAGEAKAGAEVNVYLYTDPDTPVPAAVVGYDQSADLAVLKIGKTGLTAVEIGDSDSILVGDIAIAIGNPLGLQFLGSVSQGIISGLNRSISLESTYESLKLIQTDAAINPGNSGGALVDVNGRLIGINSVKVNKDDYEGMGFAIPSNDVVRICTDLIKNGNHHVAYIGLEFSTAYSAAYLEKLGYPGGLLIESVASGSPAETAGLKSEDILVSFNGKTITSTQEFVAAKSECSTGDTVMVRIYRLTSSRFGRWTGEYYDVEVTLG